MEALLEKYSKIPQRQRYALVGLIIIALAGGYYYLFHMEQNDKISTLEGEYRKIESERAEKQAYVDNLARYEARLSDLQRNLNAARAQLPDDADVPQLLAQLGNKARQSGLEIDRFEPQGETPRSFYGEIVFAVTVRGSYHAVATFIDSLGKLDRIVNVSDLTMKNPKSVNKQVVIEGAFKVKTYRFLPEGVAEQQPKKKKKGGK
ncbi:MAG: type 4a pilus biogenesis protein PilO [Myxococcota bacterium]